MHFNGEISLGLILQTGAIIVVIIGAYMKIVGRLDRLETKVDPVWAWFIGTLGQGVRATDPALEMNQLRRRFQSHKKSND